MALMTGYLYGVYLTPLLNMYIPRCVPTAHSVHTDQWWEVQLSAMSIEQGRQYPGLQPRIPAYIPTQVPRA